MKNFFKKLSFVLAIAMVLTSIAPATASAAGKTFIYKSGKVSELADGYALWIGDKATDLNALVNGKKNVAGTWKVGNKKIATIDKETGVITPVKNGTTTVRFTAKNGETDTLKVVVGTRAAGIKVKDNGVAITELTMTAGEAKELKFGAYISGKAKAAGAKKATQAVDFTVDGDAVTTERNGNYVTVTAEEAGEATITFTAGKKTATVKVTVEAGKAEVTAKQTGANKITVTGTDLTDVVADYVVKRGNVTLAVKEIELNEEKTEAVIVAAASNMPKGAYTLTFKDSDAVEFEVVAAEVAKIVIDPECAILTDATNKTVVTYYTVYNQFDEDVTSGPLGATVQVSGSDDPKIDRQKKTVTFTNTNSYTLNLSQVSLALVSNANGVNVSKILTVSEASKLASVEFAGVYKLANGVYAPATLTEGMDAAALANHFLFFKGVDQYNRPYATVDGKLQVNPLSTTGLVVTTVAAVTVDNVTYIPYKLGLSTGIKNLGAGTVSVMTVVLNNGSTTNNAFDVVAATKVDTLTVADMNGIYGAQENELYFEAYDVAGNQVTDYATLSKLNNTDNIQQYPKVEFKRNPDGSAKLVYHADSNKTTMNVPAILTFLTPTKKFTSTNVNVQPNCVAQAIIGIDAGVALGAVTGNSLVIKRENLIFQDQYGNIMDDNSAALKAVTLQAIASGATGNFAGNVTAASGTALTNKTTPVVNTGNVKAATTGAVSVTLSIQGVDGSDYTFNIYSVALNDMADFEVGNLLLQHAGAEFDMNGKVALGLGGVYGYYNGVKVMLTPDMYEIIDANGGTTVSAPAINVNAEGFTTKEDTFKVLIHNAAATIISKTYSYSNAPAQTTLSVSDALAFYWSREVAATSNAAVTAATVKTKTITALDQYAEASKSPMYITYSEYPVDPTVCKVEDNGTINSKITFKAAGYYTVLVKYATLDGAEYEQYVTFNVK